MVKYITNLYIIFFALLICNSFTYTFEANIKTDRNLIYFTGDYVEFHLTFTLSVNEKILWDKSDINASKISITKSLNEKNENIDYVLIKNPKIIMNNTEIKYNVNECSFTLQFFEVSSFDILPFKIYYLQDNIERVFFSPPLHIHVLTVEDVFRHPYHDPYDIRGPFFTHDISFFDSDIINYLGITCIILFIFIIFYYLKKYFTWKKQVLLLKQPYQKVFEEIVTMINNYNNMNKNDDYYFILSENIKKIIEIKYDIILVGKNNSEIQDIVSLKNDDYDHIKLKSVLDRCDNIKFSNADISTAEYDTILEEIKTLLFYLDGGFNARI